MSLNIETKKVNHNVDSINTLFSTAYSITPTDSGVLSLNVPQSGKQNSMVNHSNHQAGYVSVVDAETAIKRLFLALASQNPSAQRKQGAMPSLHEIMEMDPIILSMMMTNMVTSVTNNAAKSLLQQLERASDVQTTLRDKQVKEYQEQIKKAIEQAEQARKAAAVSVLFDWVISNVELVMGVCKVFKGLLTGDVLDIADGSAYFLSGVAGMVKVGAETAQLLGADKESCEAVIRDAGIAQTTLEGIAMLLDIIQLGRALSSIRAATEAANNALKPKVMEQLTHAMTQGAENGIKEIATVLTKEINQVSKTSFKLCKPKDLVKIITTLSGEIAHCSEKVAQKALKKAMIKKLREKMVKNILNNTLNPHFRRLQLAFVGAQSIQTGVIEIQSAALRRDIEWLIQSQSFADFLINLAENNKETQQKRLAEMYQDGNNVLKNTVEYIDHYGSVLANLASGRA